MPADKNRLANALSVTLLGAIVLIVLSPAFVRPDRLLSGVDMHVLASWESFTRRALATGSLPFWNPHAFSGYPALADVQTGVLYPPNILLRWLPLTTFFVAVLALHVWILGIGTFALCRQFGTRHVPAVAAGIGIMLSGLVWGKVLAGHQVEVYGYAWFPLALALMARGVSLGRRLPHWGLVAALALQLLAGFPQGTVYVFGFLAAYSVYCAVWPPEIMDGEDGEDGSRMGPIWQCAVLFGLAVGLAAFQLLPTVRLMSEAGRMSDIGYRLATEVSFAPGDLVTLLYPHALGFRHQLFDSSMYVGIGLLGFVPLAFKETKFRHGAVFMTLLTLVSIGMALGHYFPAYRLHYLLVPQLRVPTRFLFFAALGLVVLAAIGLDSLTRESRPTRTRVDRFRSWIPAVTVLPALVLVGWMFGGTGGPAGVVLGTPLWLLSLIGATLLGIGVFATAPGTGTGPGAIAGAIVVLVSIEGVVSASRFVQLDELRTPHPVLASIGDEPGRVVSICESAVTASDLLSWGFSTPDGFGSISLGEYTRFLSLVRSGDRHGSVSRLGIDTRELPLRLDLLDLLGVRYLVSCEPIDDPRFQRANDVDGLYLYENLLAKPRAFIACGSTTLADDKVALRLETEVYDEAGRLTALPPRIRVRWSASVGQEERLDLERRYGLERPFFDEERTWAYDLGDPSAENLRGLIMDRAVEDTAGLERNTGALASPGSDEAADAAGATRRSVLIGTGTCDNAGSAKLLRSDTATGETVFDVTMQEPGFVFIGEPFYPERRVWIDGEAATLEKANLAFSGVRVDSGRHMVTLRLVPTSYYWGMAVSCASALAWLTLAVRDRVIRRRRAATRRQPSAS